MTGYTKAKIASGLKIPNSTVFDIVARLKRKFRQFEKK